MLYTTVKTLHISCVVATLTLFLLRGYWMLTGSAHLHSRWVKILPHLVDTALLSSALYLAWLLGQYPFVNAWLTAKLLALVLYIVLGTFALKRGRTQAVRSTCLVLALGVFAYIVGVALTKTPWSFLLWAQS